MLDRIDLLLGYPCYTGARVSVSDTTPIVLGNYRRGEHLYHVHGVERDQNGYPRRLVLRDPRGLDRKISDSARLVFLIGRSVPLTF